MNEGQMRRKALLDCAEDLWSFMRGRHSYGSNPRDFAYDEINGLIEKAWQVAVAYAELEYNDCEHITAVHFTEAEDR